MWGITGLFEYEADIVSVSQIFFITIPTQLPNFFLWHISVATRGHNRHLREPLFYISWKWLDERFRVKMARRRESQWYGVQTQQWIWSIFAAAAVGMSVSVKWWTWGSLTAVCTGSRLHGGCCPAVYRSNIPKFALHYGKECAKYLLIRLDLALVGGVSGIMCRYWGLILCPWCEFLGKTASWRHE